MVRVQMWAQAYAARGKEILEKASHQPQRETKKIRQTTVQLPGMGKLDPVVRMLPATRNPGMSLISMIPVKRVQARRPPETSSFCDVFLVQLILSPTSRESSSILLLH